MSDHNDKRYIGIVGDGGTDRDILARTAQVCLGECCQIVDLRRQSLRDSIDEYWKVKRNDDAGVAEREVVKSVFGVLMGALAEFENQIPRRAAASDMMILSTDAERCFNNQSHCFEPWAWNLVSSGYLGIEKFVESQVLQGRTSEFIPLVTLFIPFPSTDVFVAALREEKEVRGLRARELKQRLYNTTNLHELHPDSLDELALMFIERQGLSRAFSLVPEARDVLATLGACWACPRAAG